MDELKRISILSFLIVFSAFSLLRAKNNVPEKDILQDEAVGKEAIFSLDEVQKQIAKVDICYSEFNWREPYKQPYQYMASGSAFFVKNDIVTGEGYLLTNHHVVGEARSIQIELPLGGKERFDVEVMGVYPERDCALIRIKRDQLERVRSFLGGCFSYPVLGDSDTVSRLDQACAVGYPLGCDHWKITNGVVSGIEHVSFNSIQDKLHIQTDAASNPGNSGGFVLNSSGEVIGISVGGNTLAQNTAYVIPINDVKLVLPELSSGQPNKVNLLHDFYWGIGLAPTTEAMDAFMGNPSDGGCLVRKVYKNSIAERYGLEVEDKIYQINEFKLNRFGEVSVPWCSADKITGFDLLDRLARDGTSIVLTIYRYGEKREIEVSTNKNDSPAIRYVCPEYEKEATDYEALGGMIVMGLTHNHLDFLVTEDCSCQICLSLKKYQEAENCGEPKLVITHIVGGSCAERTYQLRSGQIITKIGDCEVGTLDEFRSAILKNKESGFIKIETEDGSRVILSIDDILDGEDAINECAYPPSTLVQQLKSK